MLARCEGLGCSKYYGLSPDLMALSDSGLFF